MTSKSGIDPERRDWQDLRVDQCDAEVRAVAECDRMARHLEVDCDRMA